MSTTKDAEVSPAPKQQVTVEYPGETFSEMFERRLQSSKLALTKACNVFVYPAKGLNLVGAHAFVYFINSFIVSYLKIVFYQTFGIPILMYYRPYVVGLSLITLVNICAIIVNHNIFVSTTIMYEILSWFNRYSHLSISSGFDYSGKPYGTNYYEDVADILHRSTIDPTKFIKLLVLAVMEFNLFMALVVAIGETMYYLYAAGEAVPPTLPKSEFRDISMNEKCMVAHPTIPNAFVEAIVIDGIKFHGFPRAREHGVTIGSARLKGSLVTECYQNGSDPVPTKSWPNFQFLVQDINGKEIGGGFRYSERMYLTFHELEFRMGELEQCVIKTPTGSRMMTKTLFPLEFIGRNPESGIDLIVIKPHTSVFADLGLRTCKLNLSTNAGGSITYLQNDRYFVVSGVVNPDKTEFAPLRKHSISTFPSISGHPIWNAKGVLGMHNSTDDKNNYFLPASIIASYHNSKQLVKVETPTDYGEDSVDDWQSLVDEYQPDNPIDQGEHEKRQRQYEENMAAREERRAGINTGGKLKKLTGEMKRLPVNFTLAPEASGTGLEQEKKVRISEEPPSIIGSTPVIKEESIPAVATKQLETKVSGLVSEPSHPEHGAAKEEKKPNTKKKSKSKPKLMKDIANLTRQLEVLQSQLTTQSTKCEKS
jgi:hypothetical protein